MNDFTKDELNTIYKSLRLTEVDYGESQEIDKVKFKILSMIANDNNLEPGMDGIKNKLTPFFAIMKYLNKEEFAGLYQEKEICL